MSGFYPLRRHFRRILGVLATLGRVAGLDTSKRKRVSSVHLISHPI